MPPAARYKLKLAKLDFVSPVDTPAQESARVLLFKSADSFEAFAQVAKVSDDLGLVFCWAFTSTNPDGTAYHDLQGDAIDTDFLKAAAEFMENGGATDELHDGVQTGRVVFAMPMTPEIAKAYGVETKTVGLMVALKPPPDVLAKFKDGTYTGVSIAGTGSRELIEKSACAGCGAAYGKDAKYCAACGMKKSVWSTADVDALPDSSFLLVESGGEKDADGKTTPRSLRHFPYRDANGKVDLPHLRNAISRIPQSSLPKDVRDKLQVRAERMLAAQHEKRVAKVAVLTSTDEGHAHTIDLDDPACEWRDEYSTSGQTAEGADAEHRHAWVFDPKTGKVTIAADSGHTHTCDVVVPADVLTAARLNELAEQQERAEQSARRAAEAAQTGEVAVRIEPVAARAPISTPSDTAATVKSESKESTAMPDLNDKIRDLEAANARLQKMTTLSDAQRAHFAKLGNNDAEQFLAMRPDQRDSLLAEIAKADEVVYTATNGKEYRKSVPLEIIEAVKATDAANRLVAETAIAKKDLEYAKRGEEALPNFAKGAKGDLRARFIKALDREFTVPAEYEEALKMLKSADAAFKELTVAKGYTPHEEAGDASPQAQLDALVAKHAREKGVPIAKAYAAVLETAEGGSLYKQLPVGRA